MVLLLHKFFTSVPEGSPSPSSLIVCSCSVLAGIAMCAAMWKNRAGNWSSWKKNSQKGFFFQSDTFSATQVAVLAWQEGVSENRRVRGQRQSGVCLNCSEQHCLPNFNLCSERCVYLVSFLWYWGAVWTDKAGFRKEEKILSISCMCRNNVWRDGVTWGYTLGSIFV